MPGFAIPDDSARLGELTSGKDLCIRRGVKYGVLICLVEKQRHLRYRTNVHVSEL